ncbi:MAG: O-acetyl-ADP-ribose deacetylase [Bacteroidales bacterium]|nr:O-acetyl-ADP-ribose deacetylase [Bacteroidales bacterium]
MSKIEVVKTDITKLEVDAIVNAANKTLLGGGGVDGAIHQAAGNELLSECLGLYGCCPGQAKITDGYKLAAKKVIHTVGPVWSGGNKNEDQLLQQCYLHSLQVAVKNGLKTIAFPNISTGVYQFPKELAAEIAIRTVSNFLKKNSEIEKVIFACFDDENFNLYQTKLKE